MVELALEYHEENGILYPNIEIEKEDLSSLNKYGLIARDYLKENHPERYRSLVRFGRLVEVLTPVQEEAQQMVDQMMEQYLKTHKPVNLESTMEMWQIREQGLRQAEEIVLYQIVNQYH